MLPPILPAASEPKVRWKPPNASLVKINFDGAIFRDENRRGISVVVRDHTSAILTSVALSLSPTLQPAEIEAIAAARALEFGQELSLTEAILEGDSELIMNSLKAGGETIASMEPLIQDAIIFSSLYTKFLYSHYKRDGNKLAHNLVRYSIHVPDYVAWMEVLGFVEPSFV